MEIVKALFSHQDKAYGDFNSSLLPSVQRDRVIGVRIPCIRKIAKELLREQPRVVQDFLQDLPHNYVEENHMHAICINLNPNWEEVIAQVKVFLPHIDNWQTCDLLIPKVFRIHWSEIEPFIFECVESQHTYTKRWGMQILLNIYLKEHYHSAQAEQVAHYNSEDYYVRMMVAWYFSMLIVHRKEEGLSYLKERKLDTWTHNMTIRKVRESLKADTALKEIVRTLRIKKS